MKKILLLLVTLYSFMYSNILCNYNNVNYIEGKGLLVLSNTNNYRCQTKVINTDFIESFTVDNATETIKLFMISGDKLMLIKSNMSFNKLVSVFKNKE